jgi:hypothetical protein
MPVATSHLQNEVDLLIRVTAPWNERAEETGVCGGGARLVEEATDDKSLPKPERKRLQIETAPHKTRDAKLLKLADKVSNLRSIAASPPSHWPIERRKAYIDWACAVAAGLVGVSDWLDKQFEEARQFALKSIPQQ